MSLTKERTREEKITIAKILANAAAADGQVDGKKREMVVSYMKKAGLTAEDFSTDEPLELPSDRQARKKILAEVTKILASDMKLTKNELVYLGGISNLLELTETERNEVLSSIIESKTSTNAYICYGFGLALVAFAIADDIFDILPDGYGWLNWTLWGVGVILTYAASSFQKKLEIER